MNTNKFKIILFLCVIGVVGCNKIENPSYMDGGGDKPKEVPALKSSISVAQGSSTTAIVKGFSKSYDEALQSSLSSMKCVADTAKQVSINKQEAAERAIKAASDAKIAAEMTRKAADDAERNTPELGGDNTLYNKAFQDTLSSMKCVADTAKQVSINKQEAAERAIKAASDAKIAAEMTRKAADDAERDTPELGGGDASTSTGSKT